MDSLSIKKAYLIYRVGLKHRTVVDIVSRSHKINKAISKSRVSFKSLNAQISEIKDVIL